MTIVLDLSIVENLQVCDQANITKMFAHGTNYHFQPGTEYGPVLPGLTVRKPGARFSHFLQIYD